MRMEEQCEDRRVVLEQGSSVGTEEQGGKKLAHLCFPTTHGPIPIDILFYADYAEFAEFKISLYVLVWMLL